MIMKLTLSLLLLLALAGCSLTGGISAGPDAINEIQTIKNDIILGQVAGCRTLLQGVNSELQGMASGSPGLPIK